MRGDDGSFRPPGPQFASPSHYYSSDRSEIVGLVPRTVRSVLDVGCGEGAFMGSLRSARSDCTVEGIEPNAAAAQAARRQGFKVTTGLFPGDLQDRARFDCVVFNDVLEHMPDPWSVLRLTRELIHPRGWVIASLPNLRNLDTLSDLILGGDFRYRGHGVLDVTHLRFFTMVSAQRLFREAGFDVRSVTPLHLLPSRKLRLFASVCGIAIPWLRREGRWRQFAIVAQGSDASDSPARPHRPQSALGRAQSASEEEPAVSALADSIADGDEA